MYCCCWEFLWYIFPEKQFGSRCGINPGAVRRTAVTCSEAYDTAGSLGSCRSGRPFSGNLEVEDHKQVTPDIPGSRPHCNTWFSEACLKTLRAWLRRSKVTGRTQLLGFPSGSVVKNPPPTAGDTGSILGLGRSHELWCNEAPVPQLLCPSSRAQKPQLPSLWALESVLCNERSHPNEKTMHGNLENSPHSPRLEKSPQSNKGPAQWKINK